VHDSTKVTPIPLESSRPKARYLVGLDAKVQARIKPLIPTRLFDRIVARQLNL
jgi:hypothetical protein